MQQNGFIIVAALAPYLRLAESYGLPLQPLLKKAGINPAQVHDSRNIITAAEFDAMMSVFSHAARDPLFGLHSARFVQPGIYGLLSHIAMSCANIREMLLHTGPYQQLVTDLEFTHVEHLGDSSRLYWTIQHVSDETAWHLADSSMASMHRFSELLAGDRVLLERIELRRPQPSPYEIKEYEAAFGCPVLFGRSLDGMWVSDQQMNRPICRPDPKLLQSLESHAEEQLRSFKPLSLSEQVKDAIRGRLRRGKVNREMIAALFNLSPRTLQRKLEGEKMGYQTLLDEVRQELALEYLQESTMEISEIARVLGFRDSSSFCRSFKVQTGVTPLQSRNQTASEVEA